MCGRDLRKRLFGRYKKRRDEDEDDGGRRSSRRDRDDRDDRGDRGRGRCATLIVLTLLSVEECHFRSAVRNQLACQESDWA